MFQPNHSRAGFSLLEAMISLAITAILMAVAIPGWQTFVNRSQLQLAAEQISQDLRQARSLAARHKQAYFIHYQIHSTGWCYITAPVADCQCDQSQGNQDCEVQRHGDHYRLIQSHDTFPGIRLTEALFSNQSYTRFDPIRGMAKFGHITLADAHNNQLAIKVSLLGRVRICRPDIPASNGQLIRYPIC